MQKEYKYKQEHCPQKNYHWQLKIEFTYPQHRAYRRCNLCGWFRHCPPPETTGETDE